MPEQLPAPSSPVSGRSKRGRRIAVSLARHSSHWLSHLLALMQWGLIGLTMLLVFLLTPASGKFAEPLFALVPGLPIEIEGLSGALLSSPKIKRLRLHVSPSWVDIHDVEMQWVPWDLLQAQLTVKKLSAKAVQVHDRVEDAQVGEEIAVPDMTLPWLKGIEITSVEVQHLTIDAMDGVGDFIGIRGAAAYRDGQFVVERASADLRLPDLQQLHRLRADASLLASFPFTLRGQAFDTFRSGADVSASAQVDGTLTDIRIQAQVSTSGQTSQASAVIRPFAALVVEKVQVTLRDLNLQSFVKTLPQTALSGSVDFVEQQEGFALQGSLQNAWSGTLEQQRLPLDTLDWQTLLLSEQLSPKNERWYWLLESSHWRFGTASLHADGELAADLSSVDLLAEIKRFNPNWFVPQLTPVDWSGSVSLQGKGEQWALQGDLQAVPTRKLKIQLSHQRGVWDLQQLLLQQQDSRLDAHAKLTQQGDHWQLPVTLQAKTFDLRDWWSDAQLPELLLNGQWQSSQDWRAKDWPQTWQQWQDGALRADIDADFSHSHFAGQPFALQVKGQWNHARWTGLAALQSTLADLRLDGDWEPQRGQLRWQARLDDLSKLPASWLGGASGEVSAHGQLSGGMNLAELTWQVDGQNLRWQQHQIEQLHGQGQWGLPWQGSAPLRTQLSARVASNETGFIDLQLSSQGSMDAHELTLLWAGASRGNMSLRGGLASTATGGGEPNSFDHWKKLNWQGKWQQLSVEKPYALRLENPVNLNLNQQVWRLGAGQLLSDGGQLRWSDSQWGSNGGKVEGIVTQWHLGYWLKALTPTSVLDADLLLQGKFELAWKDQLLNASAQLLRSSGDIYVVEDKQRQAVGVQTAQLNIDTVKDRLQAKLQIDGKEIGDLTADFSTSARLDQWDSNLPVQANLSMRIPQLQLWNRMVALGRTQIGGHAKVQANLSGSISKPQLQGSIEARQLQLRSVLDGINLEQGTLDARLDRFKLIVDRLLIPTEGGELQAQGEVDWGAAQVKMSANAKLNKFHFLDNVKQKLVVSGDVNATWLGASDKEPGHIEVLGALRADNAEFNFPEQTTPTLGSDVVLSETVKTKSKPSKLNFGLHLSTGDNFRVSGQGLKARLQGDINLLTVEDKTRFYGQINLLDATYRAWGQNLVVDRGDLLFMGPLDDPALQLTAYRPNIPDRVGVRLSGSALLPTVALISEPEMTAQEKLSWLLSGRALRSGSGAEYDVLTKLAVGIGGGGESKIKKVINVFGFDEFNVRPEDTAGGGAVFSVGKQLSNQIYAIYERAANATQGSFFVYYYLTQRLSLRLQSGTQSGADLVFSESSD